MLIVLCKLVHLFVFASLAVTQPLLGFLGENPVFFIPHSVARGQLVAFAVVVALAPTAVLGTATLTAHAVSARAGELVFHGAMTMLAVVFALQVLDVLPLPGWVASFVAAVIGVGLAGLRSVSRSVRSTVSVLAVFPLMVVGFFLFNSLAFASSYAEDVEVVALEDLLGSDFDAVAGHDGAESALRPDASELRSVSLAGRLNDRFPPIHMLVFDELPWASLLGEDGGIDTVRYPNFARLGATSHVFTNASATSVSTVQAVPAILTGMRPTKPAPTLSVYRDNLFTMLGDAYDVVASEPFVRVCPASVCDGEPPAGVVGLITADDAHSSAGAASAGHGHQERPAGSSRTESSLLPLLESAAIILAYLVIPDAYHAESLPIGEMWWANVSRGAWGRGEPLWPGL